jgi:hypothetical protein
MVVRKSTAALVVTYAGGLLLSIAAPSLLPPHYFFDAAMIRELLSSPASLALNDSYGNTATLYAWLGFDSVFPHVVAGPVSYTLVFLAVVGAAGLRHARWRPWLFVLFAAWNVPLAVYHGVYSKEVFALLVTAAMIGLSGSTRGIAAAVLVGLAYAILFRFYWGLVLALWLAMLLVWRAGRGWAVRLAVAAVVIVPLSIAAHTFADTWLSDGRTIAVEDRVGDPEAATTISNSWPNTSPFTDLANTMAGWLGLIVPLYLVSLGGAQHLAFAFFQLVNTGLFVESQHRYDPRPPMLSRLDYRYAAAATFCVAYSIVQGMFEPDFGSFAKHETILLPAFFYVLRIASGMYLRTKSEHEPVAQAR